jgi:hypothetical protein
MVTLTAPHYRVWQNGKIELKEGEGFDLIRDLDQGAVLEVTFGDGHTPLVIISPTEYGFAMEKPHLATRGEIAHRLLVGKSVANGGESLSWSRGPSKLYIGEPWIIFRDRASFKNIEEECAFTKTPPIVGLSYLW